MAPKRNSSGSPPSPVAVMAHLVAVALITLVLVWLLHFRGGLAFESAVNKNKIFNLHPLLMLVGFVLVLGEGIMAYNTIPGGKKTQKIFHLVLHLIALISGIVGIYAVFKFHNESGIVNMYSLHSWLGITTISLFGFQVNEEGKNLYEPEFTVNSWLFSFLSFAYPGAQPSTRARLVPWHAVMGMIIFLMAILTAEIGLVEKFIFLHLQKGQEALILNFTGLLIFLFAIFVSLTVVLPIT